MGKLKILAGGSSLSAQSQARGKLFEKLMAEVLRHLGYGIDSTPSVNYTGMEIDIEGKHLVTGIPLYVECKCYDKEIDSPKLRVFFANYMTKWFRNRQSQGLFIALPGVHSHADGFYRENCESNTEIIVRLYQEEQVLEAIFQTHAIVRPEAIAARLITLDIGAPGDWYLLYTDKGLFWAQYVIPIGAGISNSIALFDAGGNLLTDKTTLDYLVTLYPELKDFKLIVIKGNTPVQTILNQEDEEIVEVVGSSSCFEYQFPASPAYFVGRQPILEVVDRFAQDVLNKKTSRRGLLFQGNSGWGKSSSVLECVSRLQEDGHFAIAIDSRSASSSQFILRVVDYVLRKFNDFEDTLPQGAQRLTIGGFEDAAQSLIEVGKLLERRKSLLIIFLDQFENIFFKPDVFNRFRNLFLKICDAQTNVILGFSWKNDLIGSMTDLLPFQLQMDIMGSSQRLDLEPFSDMEMAAFLDNFSQELNISLNNNLKFFLTDFAQGYPWLLRKLCSHVKSQLDNNIPQLEIASSSLDLESLIKEDLRGLSAREEDVIRRIARVAPVGVSELDEDFSIEIIHVLIDKRLLKRIGNKYDISWDILRDYLNSGILPIRSTYVLFAKSGSLLRALHILFEVGGKIEVSAFKKQVKLADPTFHQIIKDMERLELIKVSEDKIQLQIGLFKNKEEFNRLLQIHLQERLPNNRLISRLLKTLNTENLLTIDKISELLAEWSPYMSLSKSTWREYARTFVKLMEAAHLAIFDRKDQTLTKYKSDTIIIENIIPQARHRVGIKVPWASYATIVKVMKKLYEITQIEEQFNPESIGLKANTYSKILTTLEDLEFVSRNKQIVEMLPKGDEFVLMPQKRAILLAEAALKIEAFSEFIAILKTHRIKPENRTLATELKDRLGADWRDSTAKVYVGILLNWAQHTNLAPHLFNSSQPGVTIITDNFPTTLWS